MLIKNFINSDFFKSQYLLLSRIIFSGAQVLVMYLASKSLSASLFGYSYIIISVLSYVSLISRFGFNFVIIRFQNFSNNNKVDSRFFFLPLCLSIILPILSLILLINLKLFNNFIPDLFSFLMLLFLSCLLNFSTTIAALLDALAISKQKNYLVLFRIIFASFLKIFLTLLVITLKKYTYDYILISMFGVSILSSNFFILLFHISDIINLKKIVYWNKFRSEKIIESKISNRIIAKYAITNLFSEFLLRTPQNIFPLLIGISLGEIKAGYVYIILTITSIFNSIAQAFSQTLIANKSKYEAFFRKNYITILLNLVFLVSTAILMILFRNAILSIFIENFKDLDKIFILFILTGILIDLNKIIASFFHVRLNNMYLIMLYLIPILFLLFFWIIFYVLIKDMIIMGYFWFIANLISFGFGLSISLKISTKDNKK